MDFEPTTPMFELQKTVWADRVATLISKDALQTRKPNNNLFLYVIHVSHRRFNLKFVHLTVLTPTPRRHFALPRPRLRNLLLYSHTSVFHKLYS